MKDTIDTHENKLDDRIMWQAVLDRDPLFRNVFVYAVRSTRIYCLPTCPARRPHPDQVIFFNTAEAAEKAGFRPCRRCHPRQRLSSDELIVEKACNLLEQPADKPISLKKLSLALHMSPYHLHRVFKSKIGLTPHQYASAHRLKQFKERVRSGEPVTSAMYASGFSSSSRLYENADEQLGMTPAVYRNGGKGMVIGYTTMDTSLGKILVAGTQKGLCFVCFGETESQLVAFLVAEYPAAQIKREDMALKTWGDVITRYLEGDHPDMTLPLDLQATAFQMRVWEALRKIPYGCTRSYTEIAKTIGQPDAARAVASACASNPVALVNPCHRVVRSDGKPGGYRWGEERKRALLSKERHFPAS